MTVIAPKLAITFGADKKRDDDRESRRFFSGPRLCLYIELFEFCESFRNLAHESCFKGANLVRRGVLKSTLVVDNDSVHTNTVHKIHTRSVHHEHCSHLTSTDHICACVSSTNCSVIFCAHENSLSSGQPCHLLAGLYLTFSLPVHKTKHHLDSTTLSKTTLHTEHLFQKLYGRHAAPKIRSSK